MSIKNKTISGLKWSFTDNMVNQVIHFFIGLVLARLLSPTEYGVIGMAMVFIAISQSFVDSGLSQALIRKQDCNDADYNTMFYTNIALGVATFSIVFFAAGAISRFYDNPDLYLLTRVMAINLIINSFGMVETAMLTKQIDFKRQTKISLIANITSGIIGIVLAFLGFGYWSLAIRTICQNAFRVALLHWTSKWKPKLMYSRESFREMFGFGSKLLISGLIDTIYKNIHKLVIGKYFSAADLGFYSRAEQFKNLPSKNLEMTSRRVTYPVLSSLQGDDIRLKRGYKSLTRIFFYVSSTLMLILVGVSRELILITVGVQWTQAIVYLEIISLSGVFYSLISLNMNMLNVKGRSDLYLKLHIVHKILMIPVILVGIWLGMLYLLWGMVFSTILTYGINASVCGKLINYNLSEQVLDILPTILHGLCLLTVLFLIGFVSPENVILSFFIKLSVGLFYVLAVGRMFAVYGYVEIRKIFRDHLVHMSRIKSLVKVYDTVMGS